jgi:hypothetical protein
MRARQWKRSHIMIEAFTFASGVTGKTSRALINISTDTIMLLVCFRIRMAGDTGELRKV